MTSRRRLTRGTGPRNGAPFSHGWRAWAVDAAFAAAVLLFELGPVLADAPPWDRHPFGPVDALRLAGFTLPLLLRRRFPVAVLTVVVASFVGSRMLGPGLVVAFYSVGAWCDSPRRSRLAAALGTLAAVAYLVVERNVSLRIEVLLPIAVFLVAWYLGDLSRVRRQYAEVLEERAARLERERGDEARRAATEERTRIARELHDIVAHRVSMMTVQAGAAGVVADSDPEAARRAMASVEEAGRQTLWELRRLVGVLRAGAAESEPLATRPRLDAIPRLAEEMGRAGVRVHVRVTGDAQPVPEVVELSAYRIVQEALTNVLKHAGPDAEADVIVRYGRDALELEVSDTGNGPTGDRSRGHGLIGMAERAAVFGGRVETGPRAGGGFEVRAFLPLGDPAR